MRICPQCRARTEERTCPADGYRTIPASTVRVEEESLPRGWVIDDRYRVERLLGTGGFGAVYKVRQLTVDRPCAVKVLKTGHAMKLGDAARFQREARAIAALKHPNIVQLYDFGSMEDGAFYIAMELLEGLSLADRLAEGPLPADEVVEMGVQILDALAEAHSTGIIHRDLKPENLFLMDGGRRGRVIKLVDFGIAKVSEDLEAGEELTRSGMVVGSPRYMSPEQCQSGRITGQADIYSLGCILYECLTGRPAFLRTSFSSYLMAHIQAQVDPPTTGDQHLQGPLVDFIMHCLQKDPLSRPLGAEAAMKLLEACRDAPLLDASAGLVATIDRRAPKSTLAADGAPDRRDLRAADASGVFTPTPESIATGTRRSPLMASGGRSWRRWLPVAAAMLGAAVVLLWINTGSAPDLVAPDDPREPLPTAAAVDKDISAASSPLAAASADTISRAAVAPSRDANAASAAPTDIATVQAPTDGLESDAPKPTPPPAPERDAPDVGAGPEDAVLSAPTFITVEIDSQPADASVFVEGLLVGRTPFDVTWAEGVAPPQVRVSKWGYRTRTVTLTSAEDGAARMVKLKPKSRRGAPTATPAAEPRPGGGFERIP